MSLIWKQMCLPLMVLFLAKNVDSKPALGPLGDGIAPIVRQYVPPQQCQSPCPQACASQGCSPSCCMSSPPMQYDVPQMPIQMAIPIQTPQQMPCTSQGCQMINSPVVRVMPTSCPASCTQQCGAGCPRLCCGPATAQQMAMNQCPQICASQCAPDCSHYCCGPQMPMQMPVPQYGQYPQQYPQRHG